MSEIIKKFSNGAGLKIDKKPKDPKDPNGPDDELGVYYVSPDGAETCWHVRNCFDDLWYLTGRYPQTKLYDDFLQIYDMTGMEPDDRVFDKISRIAENYNRRWDDARKVEETFGILYLWMIVQNQREHAPLGQRVMRLGVHDLLIQVDSPQRAATYMKDMRVNEIEAQEKEQLGL